MRIATIFTTLALVLGAGCGDSNNKPQDAPQQIDAGTPDASCVTNPPTHEQIINAGTDAQKIYKDSHPPLLKSDGTLPPLP